MNIELIYLTFNLISIPISHELGHYFVHKYYKREPKFVWFGVEYNLEPYNQFQLDFATAAGILNGLILFIFIYGYLSNQLFLLLLIGYLFSIRDDIFQLRKKYKGD